jgi:hypothetical protein
MQKKRKLQQARNALIENQESRPKCNGGNKTDHKQNQKDIL